MTISDETARKIDEIHNALCGTIDGKNPGIYQRIGVLEEFRRKINRGIGAAIGFFVANLGTLVAIFFKIGTVSQ